jgi:hypothetical protein
MRFEWSYLMSSEPGEEPAQALANVRKMSYECTGDWREIYTLIETFSFAFLAGIYIAKIVTKCLQFVYIFADLLIVKCLTKFSILAVTCLSNCLLLPVK